MVSIIEGPQGGTQGPSHAVHFYETEEHLYPIVARFLGDGLRDGEAVVALATPEHRVAFREAIAGRGIDVEAAISRGQLTLLDAQELMDLFVVEGMPDEARFHEVIAPALRKGSSRVRAYGEMVNVLLSNGQPEAALRLEELWNDLLRDRDIPLLCAYSMGNFYKEGHSSAFAGICARHDSFVPAGGLSAEIEIAHRKQLEKALREALSAKTRAETELRDFVQNAPVGLHWVAADGTILWANEAELQFLGYSRDEYIGRNIRDFYADPQDVEDILDRLSRNEEIHEREIRLLAKDGSTKYGSVTSNAKFENGKFAHTRCFTRDVTQLRAEQDKLKRLINSNIIAVFTRTEDGRILEANEPYLRLLGYDAQDIEQGLLRWTDSTPPQYTAKDRAAIDEIRRRGECTPYEKELIRRDGTRVPVLLGAARLTGTTHVGYAIDLTERKMAERDAAFLAEAGEIVARTLDSATLLTCIAEVFVPRFAEYCFVDVRRDDGSFERIATAGSEPQKFTEGRSLTVTLSVRDTTFGIIGFVGDPSRRPFDKRDLALAQEVARRAALAIDNAKLYAAAQNANRAKDEFLATLSHELRTPMTAILGWSRFLQIGSIDSETLQHAIEAISRAAVAQAQLIDDVLDMSRIISGKLRLELEPVDLLSVINAAVETVQPMMAAKQIALEVRSDDPAGLIWADPNRLQQAIWNLLTNAAKFTPGGGRVIVEVRHAGKSASISVRDSGKGIDPDFLPHVFERFRQAESTTTRAHGGLGLGLAIVRYIVEMHGGHITASSDGAGRGATFTIELPAFSGLTAAEPITANATYCDLSGLQVLFVDDESDTRTFVRAVLEHCGAEVKDCASAAEAEGIVGEWRPDVIITDILMPGADGNALASQLTIRDWAGKDAPPILALSGSANPKAAGKFADWLAKPIDPLVLAQAVKRATTR